MPYTKLVDNKRVADLTEIKRFYDNFYNTSMDLSEGEQFQVFLFFLDAFFAEFKFEKQSEGIWKYGLRRVEIHEKDDRYELQFHNKVYFMNKIGFDKTRLKDFCIGSRILIDRLVDEEGKLMTLRQFLNTVMDFIRELW